MKPSTGSFTGLRALRTALAVAVLGLPMVAGAATAIYNIPQAGLVNMPSNCGNGSYYNSCGPSPQMGWTWTDTLPGGSVASAVQIEFNVGVDCGATVYSTTLNGTASGTWTGTSYCNCSVRELVYTMALPAGAYTEGGSNTFSTTNATSCLGSCPSSALGGAYARVTVTYSGGGGGTGGTGTCDLTPIEAKLDNGTRWINDTELAAQTTTINNNTNNNNATQTTTILNGINPNIARVEAKLDDGTRFTSDTERTTQTNTLTTEINANETKIDALEGKLDDETRFTDDAELARAQQSIEAGVEALEAKADSQGGDLTRLQENNIEHALGEDNNVNKPMALFMLPASHGGLLEDVRDLVQARITQVAGAGCNVGSAQSQWNAAAAQYALSHWDTAYSGWAGAYKTLVMGPCN